MGASALRATRLCVIAKTRALSCTSTSSAPTPTYTDHFTPCGYGCALTSGKKAGCDLYVASFLMACSDEALTS